MSGMNERRYGNYPKKRIYFADMAALCAAFFGALVIRYQAMFVRWADIYDGLYISLIVSMCLIQTLIFIVIDLRRASVFEMDPLENAAAVFKDRTIVIVLTVIYLYITQRGELSSRFVIGMLYILSLVFDYILRMLVRSAHNKRVPDESVNPTYVISPPYPSAEEIRTRMNEGGYKEILVQKGSASDEEFAAAIDLASSLGYRTYAGLQIPGYGVKSGIACDIAGSTSIPVDIRKDRFRVFGVDYAIARTEEAVLHVIRHIKDLSGTYICFSNTHTLVMAREDGEYRKVLNGSAITFADGNPIAKLEKKAGHTGVERVAGPDFMDHMFRDTAGDGRIGHYFYGSSQETLDALKEQLEKKYPGINIKGMYSPPYRDLTPEEDEADIDRINGSGADIVWIGLGAPKQEKWMAAHAGRIKGVMMGVGAGFDFHAGTIRRAPVWMQKVGLEWLYRLFQDPVRLFKRYIITNCKFYIYRLTGRNDR